MPPQARTIPSAFNTLDDTLLDDGHVVSSFAGRELINNDRVLNANLRKCVIAKAWDLDHEGATSFGSWQFITREWVLMMMAPWRVTPGLRAIDVELRITGSGGDYYISVQTGGSPGRDRVNDIQTVTTATGAVQNVSISGIPIAPGATHELVWIFIRAEHITSADETGEVSLNANGQPEMAAHWIKANPAVGTPVANGFTNVAAGWNIRLEDGNGSAQSDWKRVTFQTLNAGGIGGHLVTIHPGFRDDEYAGAIVGNTTGQSWRARETQTLQLHSCSVYERPLTGTI